MAQCMHSYIPIELIGKMCKCSLVQLLKYMDLHELYAPPKMFQYRRMHEDLIDEIRGERAKVEDRFINCLLYLMVCIPLVWFAFNTVERVINLQEEFTLLKIEISFWVFMIGWCIILRILPVFIRDFISLYRIKNKLRVYGYYE